MPERELKKVCEENSLPDQSIDVELVATLLLREFHQGVHEEADLLTNFVGEVRPNSQLRKVKLRPRTATDWTCGQMTVVQPRCLLTVLHDGRYQQ